MENQKSEQDEESNKEQNEDLDNKESIKNSLENSQKSVQKANETIQPQEKNSETNLEQNRIDIQKAEQQKQIEEQNRIYLQKAEQQKQIEEQLKQILEKQKQKQLQEELEVQRLKQEQNPIMICSLHNKEISKVCMRESCVDRMFLCFDCAEDFSEHFVKHKPFKDLNEFYEFIKENPFTQRKKQLKNLLLNSQTLIEQMSVILENQREKIVKEYIPELKLWFDEQCEELETYLLNQVDQFSQIYQQNSHYLKNYLAEKDLIAEMQDNVPDLQDIKNKFKELENQPRDFELFLETIYRKVYNVTSVELTNQAFNYFEEMHQTFQQQRENAPEYIGNDFMKESIGNYLNSLKNDTSKQFSNFVAQFPICSKCSKQVDNTDHLQNHVTQLKEESQQQPQQQSQSQQQLNDKTIKNTANNSSSNANINAQSNQNQKTNTLQNKSDQNKQTDQFKQLQAKVVKYIEFSPNNRPGKCQSCRRYYCLNCQKQGCSPCLIQWDQKLKTSKVSIVENGTKAMFEEDKNPEINNLFKKLNCGFVISRQELFAGKYEFDVILENNDSCHTIAFGIGKKKQILQAITDGWDLKDTKANDSLILINVQGQIQGGLKGKIQKFQNERLSQFKICLDLNKGKLTITGKQCHLEKVLNDNNVGYCMAFYSQGSFKSYNSLTIKQYYSFDNI